MDGDQGPRQLQTALLKGAAVLVGICVLVALGTLVVVKALGLDSGTSHGDATADALQPQPVSPLPSTALPVPGQSATPSPTTGQHHSAHHAKRHHRAASAKGFHLAATPVTVQPMQRINLTGTYPGHDNVSVEVQSMQTGHWAPFAGVTAGVNLGTFQTYVMSGVHGPNKFRMFDPSTGKASNVVTVTVG